MEKQSINKKKLLIIYGAMKVKNKIKQYHNENDF